MDPKDIYLTAAGKLITKYVGMSILSLGLSMGVCYSAKDLCDSQRQPHKPIFKDVNGDGIEDVIVERRIPARDIFSVLFDLNYVEEIHYGISPIINHNLLEGRLKK